MNHKSEELCGCAICVVARKHEAAGVEHALIVSAMEKCEKQVLVDIFKDNEKIIVEAIASAMDAVLTKLSDPEVKQALEAAVKAFSPDSKESPADAMRRLVKAVRDNADIPHSVH